MLISRNFEKRVLDPLLVEVISLLKVYVDFLLNYNCLLVSQELVSKMELCLDILQQASSGADAEAMQMLIDRQIWKEINAILFFDDSWKANIEDINIGVDARLTRAMEGQTQ